MKRFTSIVLAVGVAAGCLTLTTSPVFAAPKTPCDFTLALPFGAHYGPASGVLPKKFRVTARRCAKYAKARGKTVQVSYPVMDSTVAIWTEMMRDELREQGATVYYLDLNDPDCRPGENVCGRIVEWG